MPVYRARIKIIEDNGFLAAKKAMIEAVFEVELLKPIPALKWKNVFSAGWTSARIGDIGDGNWMHSILGEIHFNEIHIHGGGIFGPTYRTVKVFEFFDIPFRLEFPFKSGMKGKGKYHLYHTAFSHGDIKWEVV